MISAAGLEERLLPRRLPSLTGLRAVAALAVFVVHLQVIGNFAPFDRADRALAPGLSAVSVFYVLSGFVLAWSAGAWRTAPAFLRRRAARLLPLYFVALVGAIVVDLGLHSGLTVRNALPSVTLLQSWFPRMHIAFEVNGPGWSLSDELFFSLLFPLLLPVLGRVPARFRLPAVGLLWAVEIAVAAATAHLAGFGGVYWSYVFPPLRLCEFAAGALLCLAVRNGWRPPVSTRVAALLFAGAYTGAVFAPASWQVAAITFVPVCLLVSALAAGDVASRPGRLLAHPWAVRLGDWSFAFYLVHQLTIEVLSRADHGHATHSYVQGLALAALALAVSVVAAKVLHEWVEVPLERRLSGPRGGVEETPAGRLTRSLTPETTRSSG